MDKLRLLLFEECNRNCKGCCNKDWDLKSLSKVNSYKGYNLIMLTGGEPMLKPDIILSTIEKIRKDNAQAKIYLYTAKTDDYMKLIEILCFLDGITITLHNQTDVYYLDKFLSACPKGLTANKSNRLNVFKDIDISKVNTDGWIIKDNIKWIKNAPLPSGEEIKRL